MKFNNIILIILLSLLMIFIVKKNQLIEMFTPAPSVMKPKEKVTIASLKENLKEPINEEETETKTPLTEKESKCPEGYDIINNNCKKVCNNCKLGKCQYGICGLK